MAITTTNIWANARNLAIQRPVIKTTITGQAAGNLVSLFRAVGIPAQPAIPGAAVTCNNLSAGAIDLPLPGGANLRYVDAVIGRSTVAGSFQLVDRLIHSGNLNGTLTTAQSVATPALPARATGTVRWFLEAYTALGATASNATVNVTYDDASTGNANLLPVTSFAAGRLLEILPQVAGRRITGVNTVTLSASTGTAGAFGVTALQTFTLTLPVSATNLDVVRDALLVKIPNDACLQLLYACNTTSTGDVNAEFNLIEG